MFQSFDPEGLSAAGREEQAELERRYPPLPPHPLIAEQCQILEELNRRLKSGEPAASVRKDTAWRDEV
jgi:hypothetical protein